MKRTRSAPANPTAGSGLLSSRQSKTLPKRVAPSTRVSQSRTRSRGNYQRTFTSVPKTLLPTKRTLISTSIVRNPGYTLTRTSSAVRMDINTLAFFGGDEQSAEASSKLNSKRVSPSASAVMRAAMLDETVKEKQALEIEVAELNIQIANIKEEFEQQKNQREEEFVQLTKEMRKLHRNEIDELDDKHQQETHRLQTHHNELVTTMNQEFEEKRNIYEDKLTQADEKLQQLLVEKEAALQKLKEELTEEHTHEMENLRKELNGEMDKEVDEAKTNLILQHRLEIEELNSEHAREIEGMIQKYNEAMALKDDLQKSIKKNKKLEKELGKQKEKIQDIKQSHRETEVLLKKTTESLQELQGCLQEKVWQVESNYRDRLDGLMRDNTLLRRRLLQKTDQFCEYRTNTEKLQAEGIRSTKEKVQIVLRARQKASLSIAMGAHELDMPPQQERPSSAPITRTERNNAKVKTNIP